MNAEEGTLPSEEELVVVAPRSSAFAELLENQESKDMRKIYSLPPPSIEPWDGSTDAGDRISGDDLAEELNRLTLSNNVTERERAKTWMRTALTHARDAAYWKDQATKEFERAERFMGPRTTVRVFHGIAMFMMGAGMYQPLWVIPASVFFCIALVWDIQASKKEMAT